MSPMQMAKAITGGVLAGLSAAFTALPDGISAGEWITIAVAAVTTFGVVFGVPNAQPTKE